MEWEMRSMTESSRDLLGIQSDRHAVCGRRATAVDRWHNHLLVATLIPLPYPFYHSPLHLLSGEAGGSDVSFGGLRLVLRGSWSLGCKPTIV